MKKKLSLLLALLLLLAAFSTACSGSSSNTGAQAPAASSGNAASAGNDGTPAPEATAGVAKEGMPIVDEPITLEAVAAKYVTHVDFADMLLYQELEKMTNIHIDWTLIPEESYEEKRNILIASNELPDFFLRGKFTAIDEATYGGQGTFISLNNLIEDYAPNLTAIMEEHPEVRKSISQADGNIYTLPQLNETMGNLVNKYWVNTEWLDTLGLEMPATTEEFFEMAMAFKGQDANGNGDASDEIPISGAYKGTTGQYITRYFAGAFGFGRVGGIYADGVYLDVDENDSIVLVPLQENYKEMLQFLNRLYSNGLIDPEFFTLENNKFMAKAEENTIGFVLGGNNYQWIGSTNMEKYTSIPPLQGPDGSQYWVEVSPFVQGTGTAAITPKNQYPEATMRWLDFFYSEEGTKMARLGIEGVTYNRNEDGTYSYVDEISNNPEGLTADQAISKYTVYCGGNYPQMITNAIDLSAAQWPAIKEATDRFLPYLPEESLRLSFTEDETNELNALRNDIKTYIEEMEIKYITGAESFDNWDNFTSNLDSMNSSRYVEIYAAAYDRWQNS